MSEQGDKGFTDLPFEKGVPKNHSRVRALAALDETMALLGLAKAEIVSVLKDGTRAGVWNDVASDIAEIQRQLITVSAQVSGFSRGEDIDRFSGWLEIRSGELDAELAALHEFVIPGTNRANGFMHFARAKCRETETRLVDLSDAPAATKYLNRLAKYLFNAARAIAE
ncbi:MAG: ATP:cob(I)alamin adenosyltransferase [Elusimicrobiaceae bacterium]|jgi:cob(I)alamin adenosyltransferase